MGIIFWASIRVRQPPKCVLIDAEGRVAFSHYANNGGNSIQAVQTGLGKLRKAFDGKRHFYRASPAAW